MSEKPNASHIALEQEYVRKKEKEIKLKESLVNFGLWTSIRDLVCGHQGKRLKMD